MSTAIVYISAILFAIAVFPVHVFSYVYASTQKMFAGANVSLYRLIPILKINTQKGVPPKLKKKAEEKEKEKKKDKKKSKLVTMERWLTIYNNLCITKIVQLTDFGVQSDFCAYAAITQKSLTDAIYAFVKINGGRTKLRNYTVFNYEHGDINYYLKVVGVFNLITFAKLLTVLILEKINERKIEKRYKRKPLRKALARH